MEPKMVEDVRTKQEQIEAFLPLVAELKGKMRKKKAASKETISAKMQELHLLVDKWEERFMETANETLDEKIEGLQNQEKTLKDLSRLADKFLSVAEQAPKDPSRRAARLMAAAQSGETPGGKRREESGEGGEEEELESMETSVSLEDTEDEEVLQLRQLLEGLAALRFPLSPLGIKADEVDGDHQSEFAELLDEASKSLKRTLSLIGGIVRGYMRRGAKSDKWIAMIRRLEARTENDAPGDVLLEPQRPERGVRQGGRWGEVRVWKAVSDLYKYIENVALRDEMVKILLTYYETQAVAVEFYLMQLLNVLLCYKLKELDQFVLLKCRQNPHFALHCYFLLYAMGGTSGPKKWTNRCKKLLKRIEMCLPLDSELALGLPVDAVEFASNGATTGRRLVAPTRSEPELPVAEEEERSKGEGERERRKEKKEEKEKERREKEEEKKDKEDKEAPKPEEEKPVFPPRAQRRAHKTAFFAQIDLLRELAEISATLAKNFTRPETFKPELRRLLEEVEQRCVVPGSAYFPRSPESAWRVLRIVQEETFPIPTYGRVLYFLTLELLPAPLASKPIPPHRLLDPAPLDPPKRTRRTRVHQDGEDNAREEEDELTPSPTPTSTPSPTPTLSPTLSTGGPVFGELWEQKKARLRAASPYGRLPEWECRRWIVKNGDFVLQEQFVMELLELFQRIFETEGVPLHLTTYRIWALSTDSGFIEVVNNAMSLDKLKSRTPGFTTLADFFRREWPEKEGYARARSNFLASLAGYSLVCYFLQIKDRHNGNIMLDAQGHLLHIDFGYLLGRTIKFEKAPFKLTEEMIEVLGGDKSKHWKRFIDLLVEGFLAARQHYEQILLVVEMSLTRAEIEGQFLPCLDKESVVKNLRKRFRLEWNEAQIRELVLNLVAEARENWRTLVYDSYQRILNDIY